MKTFLLIAAFVLQLGLAHAQDLTANATYRLTPDFPKYVTAHIEFRDPTGARWPSVLYGKPMTNGIVRLGAQPGATFSVVLNQRAQKAGDQSRRVLGDLFASTNSTPITVSVERLSGVQTEKKGSATGTLQGLLEFEAQRIPFKAVATFRPHTGKGDEKNEALFVDFAFDVKAGELGLKTFNANAVVQVRVAFTAYSEAAISAAASRSRPRP